MTLGATPLFSTPAGWVRRDLSDDFSRRRKLPVVSVLVLRAGPLPPGRVLPSGSSFAAVRRSLTDERYCSTLVFYRFTHVCVSVCVCDQ